MRIVLENAFIRPHVMPIVGISISTVKVDLLFFTEHDSYPIMLTVDDLLTGQFQVVLFGYHDHHWSSPHALPNPVLELSSGSLDGRT